MKLTPTTTPKKYHYTKKTGRPKGSMESIQEKLNKIKFTLSSLQHLYFEGLTDAKVAQVLGITRQGLHKWKKDETFRLLLKDWKESADLKIEHSLFERGHGYTHPEEVIFQYQGKVIRANTLKHYPPDPTSMIFWLKNRQPDKWRDKHELEHTGDIILSYGDDDTGAAPNTGKPS